MLSQSGRKNPSCSDVVAVAESARDAQNLIAVLEGRIIDQPVDMHTFGNRSRFFKGERRFLIAIGAGSSKD